jgi:hypothetical protein
MARTRAHLAAINSTLPSGPRQGNECNVPIRRAPQAAEFFLDETMDFHFSRAASEQPGNAGTPLVNFPPVCFPIRHALAGANLWPVLVPFHHGGILWVMATV